MMYELGWEGDKKTLLFLRLNGERLIHAPQLGTVIAERAKTKEGELRFADADTAKGTVWRALCGKPNPRHEYLYRLIAPYACDRALRILLNQEVERILMNYAGEDPPSVGADRRVGKAKAGNDSLPDEKIFPDEAVTLLLSGNPIEITLLVEVFDKALLDKAGAAICVDPVIAKSFAKSAKEIREGFSAELRSNGSWERLRQARDCKDSEHLEQGAAPSDPSPEARGEHPNLLKTGETAGPRVTEPASSPGSGHKRITVKRVALAGLLIAATVGGFSFLSGRNSASPKPLDKFLRNKPDPVFTFDLVIAPIPDPKGLHLPLNKVISQFFAEHGSLVAPWKIKVLDDDFPAIKSQEDASKALKRLNARCICWFVPDANTSQFFIYKNLTDGVIKPGGKRVVLSRSAAESFENADKYCVLLLRSLVYYLAQIGIEQRQYDQVIRMVRRVREADPWNFDKDLLLFEAISLCVTGRASEADKVASTYPGRSEFYDKRVGALTPRKWRAGIMFEAGRYEEAYRLMESIAYKVRSSGRTTVYQATLFMLPNLQDLACLMPTNGGKTLLAAKSRVASFPLIPRYFPMPYDNEGPEEHALAGRFGDAQMRAGNQLVRGITLMLDQMGDPGVYEIDTPPSEYPRLLKVRGVWKRPLSTKSGVHDGD